VAWSRLGSAYQSADLQQALEQDRVLFELDAMIRPMGDLRPYLADMAAVPTREKARDWLAANDRFRLGNPRAARRVRAAAVAGDRAREDPLSS
jgi:hypothetical protein